MVDGKSKAARRVLPMQPPVAALLARRNIESGSPADGWVFPARSGEGHLTGDSTKDQHTRALKVSEVKNFVPYSLRHTGLTHLGKVTNGDVFALARIAGHSSITITQRYVHPQADTIEAIFSRAVKPDKPIASCPVTNGEEPPVGTILGTGD